MCEVILLFEGYSTQLDEVVMDANCSCTLIKTPDRNIIVDTLTAWEKQELLDALAKHNVSPESIKYVVCTHGHSDHIGNNNLFLEAEEHIVGLSVHRSTLFRERNIKEYGYKLAEGITVIATPGHTAEDVSVMVQGKFEGVNVTVAITGDLFEKEEDIDDPTIWISIGAPDLKEVQAESRCKVANEADVIIPGHGPAFRVTQEIRDKLTKQLEQIKLKQL